VQWTTLVGGVLRPRRAGGRDNDVHNGRRIAYHDSTQFLVQVGKGKGAYRTRDTIIGNLTQAVLYYNSINIGNKYKKRLLMPSSSRNPILARHIGR
jgi:hypothetical protein